MPTTKTIGELNGKWAMLLKIWLASVPFFVFWAGWITVKVFNDSERITEVRSTVAVIQGNRFTASDAHAMEMRVDQRFDKLPPDWFEERMDKVEKRLDDIEKRLPP